MKRNVIIALFSVFAILCSCDNSAETFGSVDGKWILTYDVDNIIDTVSITRGSNSCNLDSRYYKGNWSGNNFYGEYIKNVFESTIKFDVSLNGKMVGTQTKNWLNSGPKMSKSYKFTGVKYK